MFSCTCFVTTDPAPIFAFFPIAKLGNIVAEQKFKKEIAEEALNAKKAQFGSIPGFKKVTQTPEGEETFLQASNVGLGGIRSNLNNPLEGLFLDPVWKEAIEQGIDLNLKIGHLTH